MTCELSNEDFAAAMRERRGEPGQPQGRHRVHGYRLFLVNDDSQRWYVASRRPAGLVHWVQGHSPRSASRDPRDWRIHRMEQWEAERVQRDVFAPGPPKPHTGPVPIPDVTRTNLWALFLETTGDQTRFVGMYD